MGERQEQGGDAKQPAEGFARGEGETPSEAPAPTIPQRPRRGYVEGQGQTPDKPPRPTTSGGGASHSQPEDA
jgi:hypothetical protein